jgi:hypothetical protein
MNVMDTDKPFQADVLRCVSTIIPSMEDGRTLRYRFCHALKASLGAGAGNERDISRIELYQRKLAVRCCGAD